jgi:hypothetical protein
MTVKALKKPIPYAGKEEKSTWRGEQKPRKLLQRNDRFTADILGELMPDVIAPRLKMPTKDALEKLASILEGWRIEYWRAQHIEPLQHKAAITSLDLLSTLMGLREKYSAINGAGNGILADRIETIDHAREAIGRLFNKWIAIEHSGDLTWHWLANVLPVDFATAIQTTNPTYKIGIGHAGPLARFIEKIVPLLTGEQPTVGTVATQLKDFRKKFLTDKQFGDRIPPP